jgi:hypothetical protein
MTLYLKPLSINNVLQCEIVLYTNRIDSVADPLVAIELTVSWCVDVGLETSRAELGSVQLGGGPSLARLVHFTS